jgi:hypothetical protein
LSMLADNVEHVISYRRAEEPQRLGQGGSNYVDHSAYEPTWRCRPLFPCVARRETAS